jgi:hypothetical protein
MERHILKIVIDFQRRHWKCITIYKTTEVSLQQNSSHNEQKTNKAEKVKTIKIFIVT